MIEDRRLDLGGYSVGMRPLGAGQAVEQPGGRRRASFRGLLCHAAPAGEARIAVCGVRLRAEPRLKAPAGSSG
jgi:hypothetical protein